MNSVDEMKMRGSICKRRRHVTLNADGGEMRMDTKKGDNSSLKPQVFYKRADKKFLKLTSNDSRDSLGHRAWVGSFHDREEGVKRKDHDEDKDSVKRQAPSCGFLCVARTTVVRVRRGRLCELMRRDLDVKWVWDRKTSGLKE